MLLIGKNPIASLSSAVLLEEKIAKENSNKAALSD
jgi:hypothetical protein